MDSRLSNMPCAPEWHGRVAPVAWSSAGNEFCLQPCTARFFPSPVSDIPQTALAPQSPQLCKAPPKLLHFQIMVTCLTTWLFQSAPQELDCPLVESSWIPEVPSFITIFNNGFRVVFSFLTEFCLTWMPVTFPGIYGKSSPLQYFGTQDSLLVQHLLPLRMLNLQFSDPRWSLLLNNSTIIVSWISSYVLVLNKG